MLLSKIRGEKNDATKSDTAATINTEKRERRTVHGWEQDWVSFGRVYALGTVKRECLPKGRGSECPPPQSGENVPGPREPLLRQPQLAHSPRPTRPPLSFVRDNVSGLDSELGSDSLNGTV